MTIRTQFDGEKILLPKELEGHYPCEVQIILSDEIPVKTGGNGRSVWDVVARSRGTLESSQILRDLSSQRDEWGSN